MPTDKARKLECSGIILHFCGNNTIINLICCKNIERKEYALQCQPHNWGMIWCGSHRASLCL